MPVRTRFAPSPTGYLHIGGARTALFCWLFARHHQGEFVLRIEDTDRERSTEESVQAILQGMEWLGLDYDEGPVFQTQRFDRYREVVQQLLDNGHAYRCYCTPEELQVMREEAMAAKQKPRYNGYWRDRSDTPPAGIEPVIRFRNPLEGKVVIPDLVKGEIVIDNQELDDLVIMRSDGTPTYNLTVVVDDYDMQITHVIRGDDHVNNTPRQINILKALGAELPAYAHLPMILGEDGKRMSKRHGAVSVMQYREEGYLPEGLLNYLVRLGWSHQDQEIFSLDEMKALFSLDAVNRAGSVFDKDKLNWVNQQHLQNSSPAALAESLQPYLQSNQIATDKGPAVADVAHLLQERAQTLQDMAEQARVFYVDPADYDAKAIKKQIKAETPDHLQAMRSALADTQDWTPDVIDALVQTTVDKLEVGFGKIGLPLRIALTGGTASPPLGATVALIGREAVLRRLDALLAFIAQPGETAANS
ncbi:MAG: glutamate--tRNA ligase [Gammaproteobacteria bacterium]|nr:glutamate--tRNA ligase [Gammaproteobacteria bacterium]